MTDQTSETTPDGLDVAAVRERVEAATALDPDVERGATCFHGTARGCLSYRCGSNCGQRFDRMHPCPACLIDDRREAEARAAAAESARDAAEGVVREVRALAEEWQADYDRIAATGRPPLAVLAQHADRVLAILDRLAPVTTDATEGEA